MAPLLACEVSSSERAVLSRCRHRPTGDRPIARSSLSPARQPLVTRVSPDRKINVYEIRTALQTRELSRKFVPSYGLYVCGGSSLRLILCVFHVQVAA